MFVATWLLTSTIARSVKMFVANWLLTTIAGPVNMFIANWLLTSTIVGPVNVCS